MEPQTISASEEPRNTAAAIEPSTAYNADLAGVGSAHSHFEIPAGANLDDELMTDTHNEELVKTTAAG
jgi:hypothetical protein